MTPSRGAIGLFVERPIAVLMTAAAIALLGVVCYRELPVNLMPEIAYPSLTVRTELPGSAPEEVEKLVSEPIEQQLGVLAGLVSIRSISRAGYSDVQLEFRWGVQTARMVSEIREKLDQVRLPDDAKKPLILRYDPSLDPVMTLGVRGPRDQARLRRIAEERIRHALDPLPGVAAAEVEGGLVEEVTIDLVEARLSARNLTIEQIVTRLRAENLDVAGGRVRDGEADSLLRTTSEFRSIAEIGETVVAREGESVTRLRDIASVRRTTRAPEAITRVGGRRAVQVAIYKEASHNIVATADGVRRRLFEGAGSLQQQLAGEVTIEVLSDNSRFIRAATEEVRTTALLGGLLAMFVLYCFLGSLANTAIISLAIPLSVVATFIPMKLAGVSLNVMSLGGLALGIGMLVDNSIVVLESIHRAREAGEGHVDSAVQGARRVAGAVTASTLTTVAVFFPIVFVEGIAGQLFRDQALAVVSSLLASLVVALAFIPMLAARKLPPALERYELPATWRTWSSYARLREDLVANRRWYRWPLLLLHLPRFVLAAALELQGKLLALAAMLLFYLLLYCGWLLRGLLAGVLWPFQAAVRGTLRRTELRYPRLLERTLARPGLVLGLLLAVLAATWVAGRRLGSELVPEVRQGELLVHLELPVGTPLQRTDQVVARLERAIRDLAGVEGIDSRVGVEKKVTADPTAGEHTARLRLRLVAGLPAAAEQELVERVRALVRADPHVDTLRFARPTLLSLRYPVALEIRGDDTLQLARTARDAAELMRRQPGLTDVRLTQRRGSPELHIHYDRERLTQFELDIRQVAETVRKKVNGEVATRVRWDGERIPLLVRVRPEDVATRTALERLRVDAGGTAVAKKLGEVARIVRRSGPSEIRHLGHQRAAVIEARVRGIDLGSSARALEQGLQHLERPAELTLAVAGQNREMQASADSLYFALGLALFLVYVVMASQFESLVQPLVIMLTVPLAAVGVVLALWAAQIPVSVIALIGGIVLAGIAVNNAIVLVDAINQALAAGADLRGAVLDGARTRLRPVLMTTLTTVLGLVPLTGVFGQTTGAELRLPLAVTLIAGLASATLLTLLVIPAFYAWVARPPRVEEPAQEYRPCVAMILVNAEGELLWGERASHDDSWQFPQGGIEPGETPEQAMWRELSEELGLADPRGVCRIERVIEAPIRYTWPPEIQQRMGHAGQVQHWFLLRFSGSDEALTLQPPDGLLPEFQRVAWTGPERVALAPPFKRDALQQALRGFGLC